MIGILVDVSDSMRNSMGDRFLKVVNELIRLDMSPLNQTFALAHGRLFDPEVFDLLSTLGKVKEEQSYINDRLRKSKEEIIKDVLAILERSGAESVRSWGEMDTLLRVVDDTTAAEILYYLQTNPDFTRRFVHECLPSQCRQKRSPSVSYWPAVFAAGVGVLTVLGGPFSLIVGSAAAASATASFDYATRKQEKENSVREAIEKGKHLLAEIRSGRKVATSKAAIISVQSASDILCTSIGDLVTVKQINELLKTVQPGIYRHSPLIEAMQHSVDLFSDPQFANHQKILFILSDGQRDDGNYPHQKLSDLGVISMKCFITDQRLPYPSHVNSPRNERWGPFKFTFRISSTNTSQKIPRTLFEERGWEVDVERERFQQGMF